MTSSHSDEEWMSLALRLARRGFGETSPNPMVGAVLVRHGQLLGQGWHRRAGLPHAEIEALEDCVRRGHDPKGATIYVTLEPCCTRGRTPPCTDALRAAELKKAVVAATDPNPVHAGKGFRVLERAGIEVCTGVLGAEAASLNEAFNHWIVHRTPHVAFKSAMSLDGKIATGTGESKWITGPAARAAGMKLRQGADAIAAGINTVLLDDPELTFRGKSGRIRQRIVLDSKGRTPIGARVMENQQSSPTTIFVSEKAPASRVSRLSRKVRVIRAPLRADRMDLKWILKFLGKEEVASLLVEGGGETGALFLGQKLVQRVHFFYAPKIIGGRDARKGVAGLGLPNGVKLSAVQWRKCGLDLALAALVQY